MQSPLIKLLKVACTECQFKLAYAFIQPTLAYVSAELAAEESRQLNMKHMLQYYMAQLSHYLAHNVQVDVSEEEDQFQAVTTACLTVLILAVETRLDTALQQMTRVPWATLETVSFSLSTLS